MVIEMVGVSFKFDSRMDDGIEVITLYYRIHGRSCACRRFTASYDAHTGVSRSALLNMMCFVHGLMGRVGGRAGRCCGEE